MTTHRRTPWWWIGIGYLALVGVVVGTLLWLRQGILVEFSTPESIAAWQAWREDVRQQQANPGPVERRLPKSEEPPALVLMRDYFGVSLTGALFFTSILYWVIAWFVMGATRGPE